MDALQEKHGMNATQQAMSGCGMFAAFLIIFAVVAYADITFIQIMWDAFPEGILRVGSLGGALATGASIIVLLIGKSYWFRPGFQQLAAWGFTVAEIVVSIANVILSFQIAHGGASGIMAYWYLITPATPFVALVGWIAIWQLDASTRMRHRYMEMLEQKQASEINYQMAVHNAHMHIKTQYVTQVTERLNSVIASPAVQGQIAQQAERLVAKTLTDITHMNAFPEPRTVEGSLQPASAPRVAQKSLAQQAASPPNESGTDGAGLSGLFDKAVGLIQNVASVGNRSEPASTPSPAPSPDPANTGYLDHMLMSISAGKLAPSPATTLATITGATIEDVESAAKRQGVELPLETPPPSKEPVTEEMPPVRSAKAKK